MPTQRPSSAPVLLLTGFEPFGGDLVNPSWEIASRLDGWEVRAKASQAQCPEQAGGAEGRMQGPELQRAELQPVELQPVERADPPRPVLAVVRSVLLPCVFHQALAVLDQAIARHRPVAVMGLGLAASRPDISVERVAINVDDARIPDNAGRQPIDEPVCPGAPTAYWSTLPIKSIVAALQEAGIPASVSQSAGTFVCNHVFFGLAHRLARRRRRAAAATAGAPRPAARASARGGFIHVPWPATPEGVEEAVAGAMDLQTMVAAIRIAIRVTLTSDDGDALLPGGAID